MDYWLWIQAFITYFFSLIKSEQVQQFMFQEACQKSHLAKRRFPLVHVTLISDFSTIFNIYLSIQMQKAC